MKNLLFILYFFALSTLSAQNIVIVGGDATEAFDSVPSDHTVGNPCDVPYYTDIFYNGDYVLPGDLYIQYARVTIYGTVDYNGYTVTLLCGDDSEFIIQDETLSIPEFDIDDITLFPNPTSGIFHVNTSEPYQLQVYDTNGKYITNQPDITNFPSGIYLVRIIIGNKLAVKRIIRR